MTRLRMVNREFLVTPPDPGQGFRTEILVPQDTQFFSVGFAQGHLYAWYTVPPDSLDKPATGPLARLLVLTDRTTADIPLLSRFIGTAIRASDGFAVHVFDLGVETP